MQTNDYINITAPKEGKKLKGNSMFFFDVDNDIHIH